MSNLASIYYLIFILLGTFSTNVFGLIVEPTVLNSVRCKDRGANTFLGKYLLPLTFLSIKSNTSCLPLNSLAAGSNNSNKSFRFVSENPHKQSIFHIYPPINEGGSNISFWSAPRGDKAKRKRPLNIKVHGRNDYYDKGNRHVSFYTQDSLNNQPKAIQWYWGDDYNAILELPTMGLKVNRIYNEATGNVASPYGLYISDPNKKLKNIKKNYGIFLENQTAGELDNYAIYSLGAKSFFDGPVGLGKKNPKFQLDVRGDVNFSGDLFKNGSKVVTNNSKSCDHTRLINPKVTDDYWVFFYPYPIKLVEIFTVISGAPGSGMTWNVSRGSKRNSGRSEVFPQDLTSINQDEGDAFNFKRNILIPKKNHLSIKIKALNGYVKEAGLTICHTR